jgi:hypothetical protein
MGLQSRVLLRMTCLTVAISCGCTATQLRRHTVSQAETVHDIYQQQVLDNLAMFVHNRNSYPYFSLLGQGTTSLTDTASLADTNSWGRIAAGTFLYATAALNPTLTRAQMGSWQTYPINDSVKLNVMQCIYRQAVDSGLGTPTASFCPDCANLYYAYFNIQPTVGSASLPYYGGPKNDPMDPTNNAAIPGNPLGLTGVTDKFLNTNIPFGTQDQYRGYMLQIGTEAILVEGSNAYGPTVGKQTTVLVLAKPLQTAYNATTTFTLTQQIRLPIRGIVTPECLEFRPNWFCCGPKLPKCCDKCTPQACYCGTYVWVPAEGIDQLTKLILLIHDVAYYDPPLSGAVAVTTQKTQGTPGPAAAALVLKQVDRSHMTENEKSNLNLLQQVLEAQSAPVTTTTTTTTIMPATRQATQFQPGVLSLQQSLNLLPPRGQ